ncbi:prefoldin subunit 2 [Neocloeon triangulifer]|uniref:prefoldin subunit 2 n=1 Tax=Neocloeon triangulifer TaxID=2078957 RepID=UPI00286EE245|nr:prefoldin subunit 2 [Neocloeon triangulifer]
MADKGKSPEEIVAGFNTLRNEQRRLALKISEMEVDLNEHKIVVDALEKVEDDRKCFRLINGVLVQRTVKEVRPSLMHSRDQLSEAIRLHNEALSRKGTELNEYKDKYNIRVRNAGDEEPEKQEAPKAPQQAGVLVN